MPSRELILAIDQGTTNTKSVLVDNEGVITATVKEELPRHHPMPDWVEQDPIDIWNSVLLSSKKLLMSKHASDGRVKAVGIADQGETILAWDKYTGTPVYNAIVWQDRRTTDLLKQLAKEHPGLEREIRERTGLTLDPYFSASKITWILQNVEKAREKAREGRLLIGTTDTWIVWKMSNGKLFVTDYTTASRTMLLNIKNLSWDKNLLEIFNIPEDSLPQLVENASPICCTEQSVLSLNAPIGNIIVDQQGALFGHGCFEKGEAKITLGTGAFILSNIDNTPIITPSILTTLAWVLKKSPTYALDGGIYYAGALIDYLIKNLRLLENYEELDNILQETSSSRGVFFVPAIVGLAAPYWDPTARGLIIGLNPSTTYKEVIRAAVEGLSLSIYDIIEAMTRSTNYPIRGLRADGGLTRSSSFLQLLSNMLGIPIYVTKNPEITAYGTALLAGMSVDVFPWNFEKLRSFSPVEKTFEPTHHESGQVTSLIKIWREAVARAKGWSSLSNALVS